MKTLPIFIYTFFFFYWTENLSAQSDSPYQYPRGIAAGEDRNYDDIPEKTPLMRSFYAVPDRFSLKQYAPTPQHQGNYNTCTAWAIAYAARTILEAQKQGWTNQSTIDNHAFSPAFQYRLTEPYNSDCDGAYPSEVVQTLQDFGALPIKDFQVEEGEKSCPIQPIELAKHPKAAAHKIEAYAKLWTSNYTDEADKIKRTQKSLSEGNPVIISMKCPPSFDRIGADGLWTVTESPDFFQQAQPVLRHSLCVVGYDTNKFGGAFEVQNSWGTDWGNGGYAWISEADFARFVYQAFELIQLPTSDSKENYLAGKFELYSLDEREDLKVDLQQNAAASPNPIGYYRVRSPLSSGSRMRIYLESQQPAFVYLLGTGSTDTSIKTLFPFEGYSAAMNYQHCEVALPSEDHYFEMDATLGKDYIIVLYAKEKLDIEAIRQKIADTSGTLSQRIQNALPSNLIEARQIDFSKKEVAFEVKQAEGQQKALAVIIEFEHLD